MSATVSLARYWLACTTPSNLGVSATAEDGVGVADAGPTAAFLAKLSRDGLQMVRFIGGSGRDGALGVTRTSNGAVYVAVSSDGG